MFPEPEVAYLKSQLLMRLATVSSNGRPNVATVGFEFDGQYLYTSCLDKEWFPKTPRYKNVKSGKKWVSLTVDDVVSLPPNPWKVRGIRVNGWAEIVEREDGYQGKGEYIRITPKVSWSWGIRGEEDSTKTVHKR